jgi:hypothetical protein
MFSHIPQNGGSNRQHATSGNPSAKTDQNSLDLSHPYPSQVRSMLHSISYAAVPSLTLETGYADPTQHYSFPQPSLDPAQNWLPAGNYSGRTHQTDLALQLPTGLQNVCSVPGPLNGMILESGRGSREVMSDTAAMHNSTTGTEPIDITDGQILVSQYDNSPEYQISPYREAEPFGIPQITGFPSYSGVLPSLPDFGLSTSRNISLNTFHGWPPENSGQPNSTASYIDDESILGKFTLESNSLFPNPNSPDTNDGIGNFEVNDMSVEPTTELFDAPGSAYCDNVNATTTSNSAPCALCFRHSPHDTATLEYAAPISGGESNHQSERAVIGCNLDQVIVIYHATERPYC